MKVFISWSTPKSKAVAEALHEWLPLLMQTVRPWMSASDISAGSRWGHALANELEDTKFGVICLTKENQLKPWILFEAGALAKTLADTYVCPYLIDLGTNDVLPGPLTQFQAKRANEEETWQLIVDINKARKDDALPETRLKHIFDRWWPDLKQTLDNLPADQIHASPQRTVDDISRETLELVRDLSRRFWAIPAVDPTTIVLDQQTLDEMKHLARVLRNDITHSSHRTPGTMKFMSRLQHLIERSTHGPIVLKNQEDQDTALT